MMKRRLMNVLCVFLFIILLCGLTAASAASAPASFWDRTESDRQLYVERMAMVGESCYLLTSDEGIFRYAYGEDQPTLFMEGINSAYSVDDTDPAVRDLPNVNLLFARDGCLYGLGQGTGQVYRLTDESGAPVKEAVCTLDMSFNEDGMKYFTNVSCVGEALYLLSSDQTGSLYTFALEDGAQPVIKKAESIMRLIPYQDGLLLGVTQPAYEEEAVVPSRLVIYNPATETMETLYQTDATDHSLSLAYDAASQTVYYLADYSIYALKAGETSATVCAYVPERASESGIECLTGNALIIRGYSGIYIRDAAQGDISGQVLTVLGEYGSDSHLAAVREHPDIVAVPTDLPSDLQTLTTSMVSGDSSIDVLRLSLDYHPVEKLIDKGYAADLTAYPEIMAIAEEMDPRFLEPFQRDGKLYALPVQGRADAISVNMEAWTTTLGLSPEDIPTTYGELLDFTANFVYDYGEDHPDLALCESWNFREGLLNRIMTDELAAQTRDGADAPAFDTPRFRGLLDALDAIDFSDISMSELLGENPTDDDYNEFYSKTFLFPLYYGISPTRYGADQDPPPLPLKLDESTELVLPVMVEALMISSRSAHPEMAAAYVASYAHNLNKTNEAIVLFPQHNDAVPNPNYETNLQDMREHLSNREKALETAAEEHKAIIQEDIKWAEEALERAEGNRYLLTAEAIAAYREAAGAYLYPLRSTVLTAFTDGENPVRALIEQYLAKAIDTDAFVKELSSRMRLMQLENQ